MEHLVEQVDKAEKLLVTLKEKQTKVRTEAEADDIIDAAEKADLARIAGKIDTVSDLIAAKRAEIVENKRIWDGKSSDFASLKEQIAAMTNWGHAGAAATKPLIDAINTAANAQHWKDATAQLQAAQLAHLPHYSDFLLQSDAKLQFEPDLEEHQQRVQKVRQVEDLRDELVTTLTDLENSQGGIDEKAAALDYVSAAELLAGLDATLAKLEADVAIFVAERETYIDDKAGVELRRADINSTEFEPLLPQHEEVERLTTVMEAQATAKDFVTASKTAAQLLTKVEALLAARETLRVARTNYEAALPAIEGRLVSTAEPETVDVQKEIQDIDAKMRASAEAGTFTDAMSLQNELLVLLGGFELMLDFRADYFDRHGKLMPQVIEYSVSESHLDFLNPLQTKMATTQTSMETAVAALEFDVALSELDVLEELVEQCDAEIEARKKDYDDAMSDNEEGVKIVEDCPYPSFSGAGPALQLMIKGAEAEAAKGDYVAGFNTALAIAEEVVAYRTKIAKHEGDLSAEINKAVAPIKKKLPDLSSVKSGTLKALIQLLGDIEMYVKDRMDLEGTLKTSVPEALRLLAELEKVHDIMSDIEDHYSMGQDDAARDIVAQLKKDKKLDQLPTEARNYLVEKMMGGWVSDEDHAAIQDIWSDKNYVDPAFDAIDSKTRASIIKEFKADPKIKKIETDWGTMTKDQKEEAIKYMTSIPCGDKGWKLDMPKVEAYETPDSSSGSTSFGSYNKTDDLLKVNIHKDAIDHGFVELMDTIAHEVGHKEQARMIKAYHDEEIVPGNPEYEQAKSFVLHEEYKASHKSEFDKIYSKSPKESHSRTMGDELQDSFKSP